MCSPGPMSARVAKTLANDLAADPLFCEVLANRHLRRKREMDLERAIGVWQLGF